MKYNTRHYKSPKLKQITKIKYIAIFMKLKNDLFFQNIPTFYIFKENFAILRNFYRHQQFQKSPQKLELGLKFYRAGPSLASGEVAPIRHVRRPRNSSGPNGQNCRERSPFDLFAERIEITPRGDLPRKKTTFFLSMLWNFIEIFQISQNVALKLKSSR